MADSAAGTTQARPTTRLGGGTGPLALSEREAGRAYGAGSQWGALAIWLAALVGAVALGLGISDYFLDHPFVLAYLLAYAGFCAANLLIGTLARTADSERGLERLAAPEQLLVLLFFGAVPLEKSYFYGGEPSPWLGALGCLIELFGLWLVLGARMQRDLRARGRREESRGFLSSGFYRYIRHPVHLGELLVLLGWAFEYGAWVVGLAMLVVGALVLRRRILLEEAQMLHRLGEPYRQYLARTDRVIPVLW